MLHTGIRIANIVHFKNSVFVPSDVWGSGILAKLETPLSGFADGFAI